MTKAYIKSAAPLKVGIAGLGVVGAGVVRLLDKQAAILAARAGRPIKVVAVSARGKPAEMVALTLDGVSENGPAPAGGVQVAAAPPSTRAAAMAISATPEELALGKSKFDQLCVVCHGENGRGGTAVGAPPVNS